MGCYSDGRLAAAKAQRMSPSFDEVVVVGHGERSSWDLGERERGEERKVACWAGLIIYFDLARPR